MSEESLKQYTLMAPEVDFNKYIFGHGSTKYLKLTQQTGATTVTLSGGGGEISTWQLAPDVDDFFQTKIRARLNIQEQGVLYNFMFLDGNTMIRGVRLYPSSGPDIVNIKNANFYSNSVSRRYTKIDELITYDYLGDAVANTPSTGIKKTLEYKRDGTALLFPDKTNAADNINTGRLLTQPEYLKVGVVSINPNTDRKTLIVDLEIDLKDYFDSFFNNKSLSYFGGQTLYLEITWASLPEIYFAAAAANNPSNASVIPDTGIYSTTLTNLYLYRAVETDEKTRQMVINLVNSPEGLNILTPYIYPNIVNNQAGGSSQVNITFNKGIGKTLQKVIWTPYSAEVGANTARLKYDHSCLVPTGNAIANKVRSFHTEINGSRLQQFDMSTANYEDYMVQFKKLKGSCIQSSQEYYYNWCWIDDFKDMYPMSDLPTVPELSNCHSGLDLTKGDIIWSAHISNQEAVALNHYIFGVTQRMLNIRPGLCQFVDF